MEKNCQKDYLKNWYQKNKSKHLETMKEKRLCEVCSKMVIKCHFNRHVLTNIHKKKMNTPTLSASILDKYNKIMKLSQNMLN
jgi:hypothetical protein